MRPQQVAEDQDRQPGHLDGHRAPDKARTRRVFYPARHRQVGNNHRAEDRHLGPGELGGGQPAVVNQDNWRDRNPAHQWNIAERERGGAEQKNAVAENIAEIAQHAAGAEGDVAAPDGLRHIQQQPQPGDKPHDGNNPEQHFPVHEVHQRRAGERANYWRDQHDRGNNRHQLNGFCLAERLLHGDVADRGDKTDAGALNKARGEELLH